MRTSRPKPWAERQLELGYSRLLAFHKLEWALSWVAYALGNWAFLDVLDHLGTFSVLVAVVFYFADSGNRLKQRHYQAWQVINTAQGKGGSGGRIEAVQELNADGISLVGVDASGAFLQRVSLPDANLARCDLHAADLRNSTLRGATLDFCNLRNANFRSADLTRTKLRSVQLDGADLHGTNLRDADLSGATLAEADLREADVGGLVWKDAASMRLANVWGVRNAAPEFLKFAEARGAVSLESDEQWDAQLRANRGQWPKAPMQ